MIAFLVKSILIHYLQSNYYIDYKASQLKGSYFL